MVSPFIGQAAAGADAAFAEADADRTVGDKIVGEPELAAAAEGGLAAERADCACAGVSAAPKASSASAVVMSSVRTRAAGGRAPKARVKIPRVIVLCIAQPPL